MKIIGKMRAAMHAYKETSTDWQILVKLDYVRLLFVLFVVRQLSLENLIREKPLLHARYEFFIFIETT